MFSTRAVEAVPERVVNSVADWANAAALVKRLLSDKYTCIFQALCDFTRSRPCSRTRSTAASIAEGVISLIAAYEQGTIHATRLWGDHVEKAQGSGIGFVHKMAFSLVEDYINYHYLRALLHCLVHNPSRFRARREFPITNPSLLRLSSLTPEVLPCTAVVETFFFPSQPQLRN